jgi:hypothetical protein
MNEERRVFLRGNPNIRKAKSVQVAVCDDEACNCGMVTVCFVDMSNNIFATASLHYEVAVALAQDIVGAAGEMMKRDTKG